MYRKTLNKNQKLLTKNDYDNVFAKAKCIRGEFFTLLVRQNDLGHSRIGSLIAKKKVKQAVARNKIRRFVKESFRLRQDEFNNLGLDIVFLLKKRPACGNLNLLFTELTKQWKKFNQF